MFTALSILVGLLGFLLFLFVFMAAMYALGKMNMQATFVQEGTAKIIVRGSEIKDIFLNFTGYVIDRNTWNLVPETSVTLDMDIRTSHWWEEKFGFYWVSIFYPMIRVYKFTISKERLVSAIDGYDDIGELVEHEDGVLVDHLRIQFPRPFIIRDVDFQDGTRVHFLVLSVFRVLNPYKIVFVYGGEKFFDLLSAATKLMLVDYCRNKRYKDDFLHRNGVEFQQQYLMINDGATGTKELVGAEAISGKIEEFDISEEDQEMQDAVQAEQIADLKARAAVKEAEGKRDAAIAAADGKRQAAILEARGEAEAKEIIANAERHLLEAQLAALTNNKVSPADAVAYLQTLARMTQLTSSTSKVTTYVEGGSAITPTLPLR